MCFPKQPNYGAHQAEQLRFQQEQARIAEEQRQKMLADEQKRQDNIRAGNSAIENAFTQFNQPYFDKAKTDYLGFYLPQVDEQYGDARGKAVAKLFERGVLESTAGADTLSKLDKRAADERGKIGGAATDFAGGLKQQVDASKNNLFDLSRSAADPNAVAARAAGEAATLAAVPGGYKNQPIGNVFADLLEPLSYAAVGRVNALPRGSRNVAPIGGSGSLRLF